MAPDYILIVVVGSADTFLSSEPPTVEEIENFKSDVTSEGKFYFDVVSAMYPN